MSKWKTVKLKDVCLSITDGDHQAPPKVDSGIPFITISNIDPSLNAIDFAGCNYVPEDYYISLADNRRAKKGDVLYSAVGSFGIPVLVKSDDRFVFQRHIAILRPGPEIDSSYLAYVMKSRGFYHWADSVAIGAAQRTVTLTQLREKEIELPTLDEQKKISGILSAYDELIENNRKRIALLEEAAQRLYKEWFVDLKFPDHEITPIEPETNLPEGWEKALLPDVADVQYGFAFKSELFNDKGHGRPIIRIRNVPDGFSGDCTTEIADDKYLVNDGDVVVGMDGEFYINTWHGGTAYLVQRSCRIKGSTSEETAYLRYAIQAPIRALQNGIVGATVSHLGKKHLDAIELVYPSKDLMGSFRLLEDDRLALCKQNMLLKEARDRLLTKLMSGEIEVN